MANRFMEKKLKWPDNLTRDPVDQLADVYNNVVVLDDPGVRF